MYLSKEFLLSNIEINKLNIVTKKLLTEIRIMKYCIIYYDFNCDYWIYFNQIIRWNISNKNFHPLSLIAKRKPDPSKTSTNKILRLKGCHNII